MNRQTVSYLSKRLTEAGLRPVSRFGQNFLVDLNLVDLIARSGELTSNDVVLEIGTGVGSLTSRLAEAAGAVLSVEIDRNLHALASRELADRPNVKLIQGDALRNKNSLRSDIFELVAEAMQRLGPESRFKMVANLPYNVATPILSNLARSTHARPPQPSTPSDLPLDTPLRPHRMVATIQKELADRMVAAPGTKDYGALSVWLQSLCEIEIVRVLPPSVFWPRPKVHSAIVRIDPIASKYDQITDLDYFHQTVRALFFHRRKFLRSVVVSAMKGRMDKANVDEVLGRLGFDGETRAEALEPSQIRQLVDALREAEAVV